MKNNKDQKNIKTCKNTQESPLISTENSSIGNPIYNMGLTKFDPRLSCDEFTFPRKLDNLKMVVTEDGAVPVLHSVPCDEYSIASLDWVTFSFDQDTLGKEFSSINPELAEETLTYAIENWLDQHLYEIFGFGLLNKREKGMHFYKFSYELQDNLGMVLYGHNSKRIAVQINGTGCALARKGWETLLYKFLKEFAKKPKLNRVDLAHDDFTGEHLSVDFADDWDDKGGFWCGGRQPNILKFGNWKRPTGKGRSFCVGDRTSSKYLRIYERGKKEGSVLSPWCRAEVEFKANDRHIPLEILLSPSQYFIGAYPCFQWLAKQLEKDFVSPEKTEIIKEQSQINWNRAIEIVKEQFGKYIRQFSKIIEPNELITMLSSSKDEIPKRLKFSHTAVIQSIRVNQPIPSHLDELPLFVGVRGVNDSAYKEFINAV
ncbi:replication initiation factor domain-containing protein [Acinetobacter baumannii]|nr:replication initiation factor domain-containing protein [Acinetobacter baumannii]EXA63899.1 replication initiation factor family protein [Acinetobacter baumannii 984213]MDC4585218.1 replication initiation factor domain-containing protein [Acinetobacter baumannii]